MKHKAKVTLYLTSSCTHHELYIVANTNKWVIVGFLRCCMPEVVALPDLER